MELRERLRIALDRRDENGPALRADFSHDESWLTPAVPAAVLIAIIDQPDPQVLLTVRNAGMRKHAGQVAFPGGRVDPEDIDTIAAALREAEEEIGIPPSSVDIIGLSDDYRTATGYHITPVIGLIPPGLQLVPHEAEVAATFEVPLSYILEAGNHIEARSNWQGRDRRYFEILWQDFRIWGATAGIIVNLSRRIGPFL